MRWVTAIAVLAAALPACVGKNAGFDTTAALVKDRGHGELRWRGAGDDEAIDRQLQELLGKPIGAEEAVRIALVNSAELQASFEDLGVRRAELLSASALPNPELDGEVGYGDDQPHLTFAATISVSRLFFVPLRRAAADAQLAAEAVKQAQKTLDLAARVRVGFYDYQATEQLYEVARTVLAAAAASFDIAERLHRAGNLTDLDFANERVFYEEARVVVANAEVEVLAQREALNAAMGLSASDTSWKLSGRLEDLQEEDLEADDLEATAIASSLDLLELELLHAAAAKRANLARAEGLLPHLSAGVHAERQDGAWEVGPTIALELPLFDHGQGEVAAAKARMRQLGFEYRARAVAVRAATRAARNQLVVATRRALHYRDVLLPLRQQILDETQKQYNAMSLGVFQLLDAKREEVRTGREYVVALRDYWRARSNLDQVLAGRMISIADPNQLTASPSEMTRAQGGH